jgi:hypothetical protein
MARDMWDAALPEAENREYVVLPAGDYIFEVTEATGKEYVPSTTSKIKRCAMIALKLRIEGPQDATCFENLYGDPSTLWKVTTFAKSIGVYHDGMTMGELLRKCQGAVGKASFIVHEYNGKKSNRVREFIAQSKPAEPDLSEELPF